MSCHSDVRRNPGWALRPGEWPCVWRASVVAMPGNYYVYMMSSPSRTLYVGFTNDLVRRVSEHRQEAIPGFSSPVTTACSSCTYEWETQALTMISGEKQIKGLAAGQEKSPSSRRQTTD